MQVSLENIERLPQEARGPVRKYTGKIIPALAENLRSLAVFGSATGADYVRGRSDVNLLVGVRILGVETLRAARPPATRRLGRLFIAPLMLTRDYINGSADTFPIEFLEMRERQILLYGENFLDGLEVHPADVRRECERELRVHLVSVRQGYLDAGRSKRDVERMLHTALTSLLPIFRQALRLRNQSTPTERLEVLAALGPAFAINPEPMLAIERDRIDGRGIDGRAVDAVFDHFQRELEKLARAVDRM